MRTRSVLTTLWIPLAVVIAIGVETRFVGLSDRSLSFDEAYSVTVARYPVPEIVRYLASNNDTHPPLHYALLSTWLHLFGSSEVAVRGLSALIGLAMVVLLYAFARRLVDRNVALVASALLAGSAFAVQAAQEARMYPLLGLLALGSWASLRLALEADRRPIEARSGAEVSEEWDTGRPPRARSWIAAVVTTALLLYTHHFRFL